MSSNSFPNHETHHYRHEASPLLPTTTANELEGADNIVTTEVSPFQLEQFELDFIRREARSTSSDCKERVLLVTTVAMVLLTMGACYSVLELQKSLAGFTSKMIPMTEIP